MSEKHSSATDDENNRPLPGALPCPFCGGTTIASYEGSTFRWRYAACNDCGAQADEVRIETIDCPRPQAIEKADVDLLAAWNTRAPRSETGQQQAERIMDLEREVLELTAKFEQANIAASRCPHGYSKENCGICNTEPAAVCVVDAQWEKVMMHDPRATQAAMPGKTILGCIDNKEQWWILRVPKLPRDDERPSEK